MKSKLLIVCVCLFIITLQSWAQIRLGVKGGINLSKISFSGESSNLAPENRTGFYCRPCCRCENSFFRIRHGGVGFVFVRVYLDSYFAEATLKSIEVPVQFKMVSKRLAIVGCICSVRPSIWIQRRRKARFLFPYKERNTSFNVGGGIVLLNHLQLGLNYNFAITRTATLSVPTEIDGSFY